jgi:hypothetical protein
MTRKGGAKFATPITIVGFRTMAFMQIVEIAGSQIVEPNAFSFIPNAPFRPASDPPPDLSCLKAVKRCLTLFLPPNYGFGESFCGSGMRLPHKFPTSPITLEPAGWFAKSLDDGLGAVHF